MTEDVSGQKFSMLTAITCVGKNKHKKYVWRFSCDCGNIVEKELSAVKNGYTKSCGCYAKRPQAVDITGEKFGVLTVVKRSGRKGSHAAWECVCQCGRTIVTTGRLLRLGQTRTCGCRGVLPEDVAFNALMGSYKRSAKERDHRWQLSKDQFQQLTQGRCFYCNQKPSQIFRTTGDREYIYNGIDRVNSHKGYLFDNCISCCWKCNSAKKTMSENDFREWVCMVYTNWASADS